MSDNAAIKSSQPGRYGVAGPVRVSLQPAATGTVWNLQGAADNAALIVRATSLWGVETLPARHRIVSSATHRLMWVGPRSWLVFSLSRHASAGVGGWCGASAQHLPLAAKHDLAQMGAAVDVDFGTVDEAGIVAAQESHQCGDFVRPAGTACRHQ